MLDTTSVMDPEGQAVDERLIGDDLLEAIAQHLESYGNRTADGIEAIEWRQSPDVMSESIDGTVFAWVAEGLQRYGIAVAEPRLGEVLRAMEIHGGEAGLKHSITGNLFKTDIDAMIHAAHEIGCHCNGDTITGRKAAHRLRMLKEIPF